MTGIGIWDLEYLVHVEELSKCTILYLHIFRQLLYVKRYRHCATVSKI